METILWGTSVDDIRKQIVKLIYEKGEAHVGSCLSCVEILQAIKSVMKDGDTFILSKAHAQRAVDVVGMKGVIDALVCYGGSLGNGVGIGLGIALARPDKMVYVLVGDGELDEGSNWEAIRYIQAKGVNNIEIHVDFNGFGAYRSTVFPQHFAYLKVHHTIKGRGVPELEGTLESHYHKITKEEMECWCA